MSSTLSFLFEIERKDFTLDLCRELIKTVLDSYEKRPDDTDINEAATKLYGNGKGFVAAIPVEMPYLAGRPSGITLSALTVDNEELRSE